MKIGIISDGIHYIPIAGALAKLKESDLGIDELHCFGSASFIGALTSTKYNIIHELPRVIKKSSLGKIKKRKEILPYIYSRSEIKNIDPIHFEKFTQNSMLELNSSTYIYLTNFLTNSLVSFDSSKDYRLASIISASFSYPPKNSPVEIGKSLFYSGSLAQDLDEALGDLDLIIYSGLNNKIGNKKISSRSDYFSAIQNLFYLSDSRKYDNKNIVRLGSVYEPFDFNVTDSDIDIMLKLGYSQMEFKIGE